MKKVKLKCIGHFEWLSSVKHTKKDLKERLDNQRHCSNLDCRNAFLLSFYDTIMNKRTLQIHTL